MIELYIYEFISKQLKNCIENKKLMLHSENYFCGWSPPIHYLHYNARVLNQSSNQLEKYYPNHAFLSLLFLSLLFPTHSR